MPSDNTKKVYLAGRFMLPEVAAEDKGKVLTVDANGKWIAKEAARYNASTEELSLTGSVVNVVN